MCLWLEWFWLVLVRVPAPVRASQVPPLSCDLEWNTPPRHSVRWTLGPVVSLCDVLRS